jgi:hypothetical protein
MPAEGDIDGMNEDCIARRVPALLTGQTLLKVARL